MEAFRMNCPACDRELKEIQAGPIKVDICEGGCGGVWFDWFELSKVDEPFEFAGEELLEVERNPLMQVDRDRRRSCPSCENEVPMRRHYFGVKRTVEVDECPACGGFWLDSRELGQIREIYPSEAEARREAQEVFDEIIEEELGPGREASRRRLEHARRFARMVRVVCPSYYIPGKQE